MISHKKPHWFVAFLLTIFIFVFGFGEAVVAGEITLNPDPYVKLKGNVYRINMFGNSLTGKWQQLVCESVPFQMPDQGVVLMLRFTRLGSQLEPGDLPDIAKGFQLYNMETGAFLLPVGLIHDDGEYDFRSLKSVNDFDVLFYDDVFAGESAYALTCEDVFYSFDHLEKYSFYQEPLKEQMVDGSELLPMPEPGSISGETRSEYAIFLESLLEKVENGELTSAVAKFSADGKTVIAVFSSGGTLTGSTLDSDDSSFMDIPKEFLADQLEEADCAMLVHSRKSRVGQYGIGGGAAWKVYTLITPVNLKTMERYSTITVSVSDPPKSIKTNGAYSGGASGTYEPEKALEYIHEMLSGTHKE